MSKFGHMTPAMLLALGSLMVASPAVLAQTSPQPTGAVQSGPPDEASPDEAENFPVFAITSVEILRSKTKPELDVVLVRGLTSADGWTNGELVPLTHGIPPDNVLNLLFVAQAPEESAPPTGYMPIHAALALSQGHPYTGIRVRSATNSVLLKELPGYVEVQTPVEPCKQCIGRYFVAKGSAPPAGVTADQILRDEDLPPHNRVIKPTDGIADVQRDPDRLTILIGEDGRVVDAVWE